VIDTVLDIRGSVNDFSSPFGYPNKTRFGTIFVHTLCNNNHMLLRPDVYYANRTIIVRVQYYSLTRSSASRSGTVCSSDGRPESILWVDPFGNRSKVRNTIVSYNICLRQFVYVVHNTLG